MIKNHIKLADGCQIHQEADKAGWLLEAFAPIGVQIEWSLPITVEIGRLLVSNIEIASATAVAGTLTREALKQSVAFRKKNESYELMR